MYYRVYIKKGETYILSSKRIEKPEQAEQLVKQFWNEFEEDSNYYLEIQGFLE